jgi:minichromosome maintenance protein 10
MTGRYYLSPSLLYSIVRPSSNRQGYELPLDGEWVTIAIVAERGDVKLSSGGHNRALVSEDSQEHQISNENLKRRHKKYLVIKLIDLSAQSRINDVHGLRGDAYLNMMLFEADVTLNTDEISSRSGDKAYVGGSGGAFENSARFSEGSVIAICNPRLLSPYQVTTLSLLRYLNLTCLVL